MTGAMIAGAGYAAREYFVKALKEMNIPLLGIYNRTEKTGEKLAWEAGCRYFKDYNKMLTESGADLLIVAGATVVHLDFIRRAVEQGIKYIFCEKPAGLSLEEAMEIRRIASAPGVKLGVGYKMRFEDVFAKTHALIREGKIGAVKEINFNYYQCVQESSWYLDRGFVREVLCHGLDLSNWFADSSVDRVISYHLNRCGGAREDSISMIMHYSNGVKASLNGGWIPEYPFVAGRRNITFQVIGSGGYICGLRPDRLLYCDAEGEHMVDVQKVDPIPLELGAYLASIEKGEEPPVGMEEAIQVYQIIEEAEEAKSIAFL